MIFFNTMSLPQTSLYQTSLKFLIYLLPSFILFYSPLIYKILAHEDYSQQKLLLITLANIALLLTSLTTHILTQLLTKRLTQPAGHLINFTTVTLIAYLTLTIFYDYFGIGLHNLIPIEAF